MEAVTIRGSKRRNAQGSISKVLYIERMISARIRPSNISGLARRESPLR